MIYNERLNRKPLIELLIRVTYYFQDMALSPNPCLDVLFVLYCIKKQYISKSRKYSNEQSFISLIQNLSDQDALVKEFCMLSASKDSKSRLYLEAIDNILSEINNKFDDIEFFICEIRSIVYCYWERLYFENRIPSCAIFPTEFQNILVYIIQNTYECKSVYQPLTSGEPMCLWQSERDFKYLGVESSKESLLLAKIRYELDKEEFLPGEKEDEFGDDYQEADVTLQEGPTNCKSYEGILISFHPGEHFSIVSNERIDHLKETIDFIGTIDAKSTVFLVTPHSFCTSEEPYIVEQRNRLLNYKSIQAIYHFPAILKNSKEGLSIIVLKAGIVHNSILFFDFKNSYHILEEYKTILWSPILNYKEIEEAISNRDDRCQIKVPCTLIENNKSILDYNEYSHKVIEQYHSENEVTIQLKDLSKSFRRGAESYFFGAKTSLLLLTLEDFCDNAFEIQEVSKIVEDELGALICKPQIIFHKSGKMYVHAQKNSLILSENINENELFTMKINTDRVNPFYLAYILQNNGDFKRALFHDFNSGDRHYAVPKVKICLPNSIIEQNNLLANARSQYEKTSKLRSKTRNIAADIHHMLQQPMFKIGSILDYMDLKESVHDDIPVTSILRDNFNYMLRIIRTVGNDFSDDSKEPICINSFIDGYLSEQSNCNGLRLLKISYLSAINDNIIVVANSDYMKILLDAAIRNAYIHGFNRNAKIGDKIQVSTELVSFLNRTFLLLKIANNGEPLSQDLTLQKYATLGVTAGENALSGRGGNHIYLIAKKADGFINITKSNEWSFILEVLLPIANNDQIANIVYEGECI